MVGVDGEFRGPAPDFLGPTRRVLRFRRRPVVHGPKLHRQLSDRESAGGWLPNGSDGPPLPRRCSSQAVECSCRRSGLPLQVCLVGASLSPPIGRLAKPRARRGSCIAVRSLASDRGAPGRCCITNSCITSGFWVLHWFLCLEAAGAVFLIHPVFYSAAGTPFGRQDDSLSGKPQERGYLHPVFEPRLVGADGGGGFLAQFCVCEQGLQESDHSHYHELENQSSSVVGNDPHHQGRRAVRGRSSKRRSTEKELILGSGPTRGCKERCLQRKDRTRKQRVRAQPVQDIMDSDGSHLGRQSSASTAH